MRRTRIAGVVVTALVVLTTVVGPVTALSGSVGPATGGDAAVATQSASPQPVAADGGYRFDVGEGSPSMTFWLHLDLLTNLGGAGDFGFSAVGTAMDTRVVAVDVQMRFAGVGDIEDFLSNPFSRFSVVAEWELNLPFLSTGPAADEDFEYRDNQTFGGTTG